MNETAKSLMQSMSDIILAYGDSDEYSFVLRKNCQLFERRECKLVSTFASTFTALYNHLWGKYFNGGGEEEEEDKEENKLDITMLPTFDARTVVYPNEKTLRDYLSWRQVDCHINNLYNTTFWTLVLKGGLTGAQAEEKLRVCLFLFLLFLLLFGY